MSMSKSPGKLQLKSLLSGSRQKSPPPASPPADSLEEKLLPFSDISSSTFKTERTTSRMELEESGTSWTTTSLGSAVGEINSGYEDYSSDPSYSVVRPDSTAESIKLCEKWFLRPYRFALIIIGWLPFNTSFKGRVAHIILVCIWTLAIITAMITQILSCFRRDVFLSVPFIPIQPSNDTVLSASLPPYECSSHIISSLILPDIVLLVAYFFGVFLFSKGETEYLFRLASHVFIKNGEAGNGSYSKRLIITLELIFIGGLVWISFSLIIRIMSAIAGELFSNEYVVIWPPNVRIEGPFRVFLVFFSLFGFFTFDMVYLFSVLNYAAQVEMNVYLLWDISAMIKTKKYDHIDGAIKDTQESSRYLKVLNRHTATLTALALFDLINLACTALIDLEKVTDGFFLRDELKTLAAVAAGFNCVSWLILVTVPFIQAARVTHSCELLKDVGPEIRARPFVYKQTSQLDLDSIVSFLQSIQLKASIFGVPIYPWMAYGVVVVFSFVMLILFQLGIFDELSPII